MPPAERERVLAVKRGDVSDVGTVLTEIASVQSQVEDLLATGRTPLPEHPDLKAISVWLVSAHRPPLGVDLTPVHRPNFVTWRLGCPGLTPQLTGNTGSHGPRPRSTLIRPSPRFRLAWPHRR